MVEMVVYKVANNWPLAMVEVLDMVDNWTK